MIAYVKGIAEELISYLSQNLQQEKVIDLVPVLAEELNRLDPRDFEVGAQGDFVRARLEIRKLGKMPPEAWAHLFSFLEGARFQGNVHQLPEDIAKRIAHIKSAFKNISAVLDKYAGMGSNAVVRSFAFVSNADLRGIIERDYKELSQILLPGLAWKSAVVIAGSILEAILFDRLADAKWNAAAVASSAAHTKGKPPKPIPMNDWTLQTLIDIAVEIKLLPKDPADTIHQVLRDYRNFVHPKKEIRAAHPCTEAEAMLATGALDSVCNYVEKHP
jgi:hypothetical protein